MPTSDKIEPRLQQEIGRLESVGHRDVPIAILIQCEGNPIATALKGGRGEGSEPKAGVDPQNLLKRHAEIVGARDVRYLHLANAIETSLTPDQIREVAALPGVLRVIWNREERVTA